MSFRRFLFAGASMAAASVVLMLACQVQVPVTNVPDPPDDATDPGRVVPFTAALSADRSRIIRGDAVEGAAVLRIATSKPATFEWSPGGTTALLQIQVEGIDEVSSEAVLRILRVLRDPGPNGTRVEFSVTATEADVDEPATVTRTLSILVVRPAGALTAAATAVGGATIAPGSELLLSAVINGGRSFPGSENLPECDLDADPNGSECIDQPRSIISGVSKFPSSVGPANNGVPYFVNWRAEGLGSEPDSGFVRICDLCLLDGDTISRAVFKAPVATGNVVFTVEATDASGNRAPSSVPVKIESAVALNFAEVTADSSEIAPGDKVNVTASGNGGEPPYNVVFSIDPDRRGGSLSRTTCTDLTESEPCTVEYTASRTQVGADSINVELVDAVGVSLRNTIPLIVASPLDLTASLASDGPGIAPGKQVVIRTTVQGGTPPYKICYLVPAGQGDVTGGDSSCGTLVIGDDTFNRCICGKGDSAGQGLELFVDSRSYVAPPTGEFNVAIRVAVQDGVTPAGTATDSISIAVSSDQIGGSRVSLAVNVSKDGNVCPGEEADITSTASGGVAPFTFTYTPVGDLRVAEGEELVVDPTPDANNRVNVATYTAPNNPEPGFSRTISIKVRDGGGTESVVNKEIRAEGAEAFAGNVPPVCEDSEATLTGGPAGAQSYEWSGPGGFRAFTRVATVPIPVVAGNYTLRVVDNSGCPGEDTTEIVIGPTPSALAGSDRQICANQTVQLGGAVEDTSTFAWTGGDGSFDDRRRLDATYTPGVSDRALGSTTITLTANAIPPCTIAATDTLDVTIDPLPTASAGGPIRTTCTGVPVTLNGATTNSSGCLWTTAGDGGFDNAARLNAIYTAGASDEAAGSVLLTLTCDPTGVCVDSVQDQVTLLINDNPTAVITTPGIVCPGATGISASVPVTPTPATYLWTVNGGNITAGQGSAGILYNATASPGNDVIEVCVTITEGGCVSAGCAFVDVVNPTTCNDNNECTTDSCVDGACQNVNNTNLCTDDGLECTNDVCAGGVCTHPPLPAGTACGSAVQTDCDQPDRCNAAGLCLPNLVADGTACLDDGLECTSDTCSAGVCTHPPVPAGSPCSSDGLECTNDVCNAGGVCTHPPLPAGTPCGNPLNNECTDPDTCNASGVCLANHAADGTLCAGAQCRATECEEGVCTDQGPADPNTPCDDGLFCTVDEKCNGAGVCQGGTANTCDDQRPCTTDSCDETFGVCVHDINAGTCLINDQCNNAGNDNPANECEICDPAVSQTDWTPAAAGTPCGDDTDDQCRNPDECDGLGSCDPSDEPDGTACDDGLFCNENEECLAGVCGGGNPFDCDDAVACTADSCNEDASECDNVPNDAACPDDGLFCTGVEFCDPVFDCSSPGNPCQVGEVCNEDANSCD